MPILYSCIHAGDQYRITKFDDDLNPTSSYLCTSEACECPAGVRPMCRHREMLPKFIAREAVGTGWWYDYDRGGWVDQRWMIGEPAVEYPSKELAAELEAFGIAPIQPNSVAPGYDEADKITIPAPKRASWRRF